MTQRLFQQKEEEHSCDDGLMGRSPRVQSQPGMVAHGRGGGRQIPGACCPTNLSQSPSAVPVRDCLRYTQTHMHMHARTHAHVCTHNPRIPTCSDLKKQLERGSLEEACGRLQDICVPTGLPHTGNTRLGRPPIRLDRC